MKILKYLPATFVVTMAVFFSSCDKNQSSSKLSRAKQSIKINIAQDPFSLDPRKARTLVDVNLVKLFNEGLVRADKNNQLSLALAESITPSNDKQTYTIKLKDAKWSNGDSITSDDFIYTYQTSLTPLYPSDNAYQLFIIRNAKAVKEGRLPSSLLGLSKIDERTFTISLEQPIPYLNQLLAHPIFFPVNHRVDKTNPQWAKDPKNYVNSGPFSLVEWTHQDKIVAIKNENYWEKDAVKLSEISMYMVADDTGLSMHENQEIDWTGSPLSTLPLDSIESLKKENKLETTPAIGTCWLQANTEDRLLNNSRIRKALSYAIDRNVINEHILSGAHIPATGIIPTSMKLCEHSFFAEANDVTATQLFEEGLKEANLTKEDFTSLSIKFMPAIRSRRLAEAIQQQWKKTLGIDISVTPVESKVLFDDIKMKNFQLTLSDWIGDFNDPVNFLEVFKSKNLATNKTNWESPNYMQAITNSFYANDINERNEHLRCAESIIMEDAPIMPIFHYQWIYAKNPKLKDVVLTTEGHLDFKYASLE